MLNLKNIFYLYTFGMKFVSVAEEIDFKFIKNLAKERSSWVANKVGHPRGFKMGELGISLTCFRRALYFGEEGMAMPTALLLLKSGADYFPSAPGPTFSFFFVFFITVYFSHIFYS